MSLPISVDPYNVLKNYYAGKEEKKQIGNLLNRYFHIKTNGDVIFGKLIDVAKIGQDLVLTIETKNKENIRVPFGNIETLKEIKKEQYEFPQKMSELISISKTREEDRPDYLRWILDGSKPIRNSAVNWFKKEHSLLENQLTILKFLFPHRDYERLIQETVRCKEEFNNAINELDQAINLVEQGKATRISDVYSDKSQLTPIIQPFGTDLENEQRPNVLTAFAGIFNVGRKLDELIKKVDDIILSIKDTMTISRIQLYSEENL